MPDSEDRASLISWNFKHPCHQGLVFVYCHPEWQRGREQFFDVERGGGSTFPGFCRWIFHFCGFYRQGQPQPGDLGRFAWLHLPAALFWNLPFPLLLSILGAPANQVLAFLLGGGPGFQSGADLAIYKRTGHTGAP